jgi:hypothetical protein
MTWMDYLILNAAVTILSFDARGDAEIVGPI